MRKRVLTVISLLLFTLCVFPGILPAKASEDRAVTEEEYPEMLKGGLKKEQLEVILAYAPEHMTDGKVTADDLESLLQNLAMDVSLGDFRYPDVDYNSLIGVSGEASEEYNEYGTYYQFNYAELSNFLSVLTGASLTQGMVSTGSPYEPVVSDDTVKIIIPDGDGGWYNLASITDSYLDEENNLVINFEVVSIGAETQEVKADENRTAILKRGPDGFYRIDTISQEGIEETAGDGFSFSDIAGMEFGFSSGVGAWGTGLTVHEDGSFTGSYHDTNMGDIGEGYPHGSVLTCEFSGQFSNPVKVNEYSWSFSVDSLELSREAGTEEIIDQVRYEYSEPQGLRAGDECILYFPGTAVSLLPEEYVSWIYGLSNQETLTNYGIYDVTYGSGWSGYEMDQ